MGTIQFKTGTKGTMSSSTALGRPLYTSDTKELFIGNGVGMPKTRICTEVAINGDCVTDDSAIINAAMISLSASGGGTLKLPPGKTVAIASTIYLQSNVTLDLNRCTLKWTGNTAGGVMISTHATVAPYYLLLKPGIGNGTLTPNSNVVTMIDLDDCWYLEMYDLHYNNANTNMTVISFAPGRNKPLFGVWNGVRFFDINNIIADYSIPAKYGVYFSGGYFPTGIASTTIGSSAGSGYTVNDVVNISGGVGGQFLITSVDVSGRVTGGSLYSYGSGYTAATDASVTGGTGSGLKLNTSIDIAATVTNGTFRNSNIVVSDTGYLFANNVDSVFMTGQHTANLVANNARGCVFNSVQNSNTFKAVNNIFFDHLVCWPDVTKTGCTAVTMGNSTAIYIYQLAKDPHAYWNSSNLLVDNYGTGYEINIADAGDGFGTQKLVKGEMFLSSPTAGNSYAAKLSVPPLSSNITLTLPSTSGCLAKTSDIKPVPNYLLSDYSDLQSAINAVAASGGGVIVCNGGTINLTSTLVPKNNVKIDLNGSTLKWTGAASGVMIENDITSYGVKFFGLYNGIIDPGANTTYVFKLHSIRSSRIGDLKLISGNNNLTFMHLLADTVQVDPSDGIRNTVLNEFGPFISDKIGSGVPVIKNALILEGGTLGDWNGGITNNTFYGPMIFFVKEKGYVFKQFCDSNTFLGWHSIALGTDPSIGTGVIFNDSTTPEQDRDVWGIKFDHLSIETWAPVVGNTVTTGQKAIVINKAGAIVMDYLSNDRTTPDYWSDSFIVDNYSDGHNINYVLGCPYNTTQHIVKGEIKLTKSGKGIVFSDGTSQTSAATISNGAYGTLWSNDTTGAPSRKAIYDKIEGLITSTSNYTLPIASTSILGGVKVDGTSIVINNGVISSTSTSGAQNVSGNSITVASVSGTLVPNKQVTFDAFGNLVSTGYDVGVLESSGGSGIVSSGTSGQFARYLADGTNVSGYTLLSTDITTALGFTPVSGPVSAVSREIATFSGTTGKVLQNNTGVTISAAGNILNQQIDKNAIVTIQQSGSTSAANYPSLYVKNYDGTGFGGFPSIQLTASKGTSTTPISSSSGNRLGNIHFYGQGTTATKLGCSIQVDAVGNFTDADQPTDITIALGNTGSSGSPTERFRIKGATGNVGIGTSGPTEKLEVAGNIKASGSITTSQLQVTSLAAFSSNYFAHSTLSGWLRPTVAGLTIYGANTIPQIQDNAGTSNAVGSAYGLYARVDTGASYTGIVSNAYGISVGSPSKNNAGAVITTAYGIHCEDITAGVNNYAVYTTGSTKSYFGGNVGLGNTNPTEKLDVTGNIKVSGIITSPSNNELQLTLTSPAHKAMHFNKGYGAGFTNNSFFMFNNIGSIDSYYPDWNGMQLWGHPVAWNIANSTWKGIWNSSTSYVVNDTVILGTTAYQCINPNTNQIPPNASYWNVVTLNQFPYLNIYSRSTSPVNGTDYEYVIGALNTLGDNSYLAQSIRFKSATSSGQSNENQGQIAFDTGIANALVIGRSGDVTTKGSLIINSSDWVAGGGTVSTSGGSTLTANTTGSFSGIKDGSSIKLSNGTILEVLKVIDSSTIMLNQAATLTSLTWSYKAPSAILQSNGSDYGYIKSDAAIELKGDGVFNPKIHMHGYGGNPSLIGFRANGTSASASGVVANDTLMSVVGGGYGSSGVWSAAVNMQFKAGEAWGAGSTGTYIVFNTVANGINTATEKMRIHGSGGVSIGNTTDPGVSNLSITGNTTTKAVIETYVTLTASGNTFTPNLSLGSTFGITLGATNNIGTPINVPASGLVASMTLLIKQDNTGNRTISSYPASFAWGDSGQPALTTAANKMDVITCFTVDGGTTWTCFLSGTGF